MRISDSSYRELAKQAYNVEPSKAASNGEKIVDDTRVIIDPVTGQQYKVIAVQDNNNDTNKTNDNGMQAMAVAPYINGKVDTSQIVIAYAGTNSSDMRDIDTDTQMIIQGNKDVLYTDYEMKYVPEYGRIIRVATTKSDSQLTTAQQFYDNIKKQYPEAILTTTGHSLGAYLALVIGGENRVPATTFNGPDPIRGMSKAARKWVLANRSMYNNYRIRYDAVGNAGAYFNDSLGSDELTISRNVYANRISLNPLYYHDLAAYRFNKKGQIIDKHGNLIGSGYLDSSAYNHVLSSTLSMVSLYNLKSQWSGGGISSDEELYLDVAQSYVIGQSMADAAKAGLDDLTELKTRADREVEAIWSKVDFSVYSELSAWEVRDIFASHGVTHQQIVSDFHDYTHKKVTKMNVLSTTCHNLKTKLDEAVEKKKALDNQLAGEFRTWHESL